MDSSLSFSTSYSFSRPDLDLSKWINSLRKSMEDNDEETTNTDISIFTVPKTLLDTDPDSYIPEQVAFGPFHQWRPQVYDMQKYKLAAARKIQKRSNVKFEQIVEVMKEEDEARIRACYHKFLDMDGDALAWMMAVDMAFLLEFLQVYYMREEGGGRSMNIGSRLSSVVDVSGKKLSHMAILRDVVKLENQIPLFLIKTMMEYNRTSDKPATEALQIMLMGLYHELSPFQCQLQSPNNKELGISTNVRETTIDVGVTAEKDGEAGENESFAKPAHRKQFLDFIWKIIKDANFGFLRFVRKIIFSRPIKLVTKLPWKVISRFPILKLLKKPIENMLANLQGETKEKPKDETTKLNPPLIEEITIPSVTDMAKADIFFSPVNGTISEIRFNEKTSTLYLPVGGWVECMRWAGQGDGDGNRMCEQGRGIGWVRCAGQGHRVGGVQGRGDGDRVGVVGVGKEGRAGIWGGHDRGLGWVGRGGGGCWDNDISDMVVWGGSRKGRLGVWVGMVHLDVNTKVYLRNLVAYEACVASGPLIMARYTELMNGIIDTEEDAKYLMDCRIVYNLLKSEKEVADLWNGMSKCVKMTKVPFMDKVIEEVNKRYEQTWRVKIGKFMSKYVFGSWKFLTLLAAVFLLLLSTVQTICSIYSCGRLFRQLPELDQPLE
ncbi:hypothetical protein L6452_33557 [Arctium lappa]|uniref:Uncharacterized protein n=1 Tax=Arctium lappa TaxID=4217 RepID=A0ACB8YGB5_ARCLA|nr:hypothetical protein L6452_33557 [Arctium lappa]